MSAQQLNKVFCCVGSFILICYITFSFERNRVHLSISMVHIHFALGHAGVLVFILFAFVYTISSMRVHGPLGDLFSVRLNMGEKTDFATPSPLTKNKMLHR